MATSRRWGAAEPEAAAPRAAGVSTDRRLRRECVRSPELGAVTTRFRRHPFSVLYDDVDPSGVARAGRLAHTLAAIVLGGVAEAVLPGVPSAGS